MASVTITKAQALAANKLIVSETYIPAPIQARADAIFDSCVALVERKQGTDDVPEDVLNECLLAYFGYRYQVPDMRRRPATKRLAHVRCVRGHTPRSVTGAFCV